MWMPGELFERKKEHRSRPLAMLSELIYRYHRHDVAQQSAALAYYLLFTLFPMLIFVSSLLGLLQIQEADALELLSTVLPDAVVDLCATYLGYVSQTATATMFWFSLVFSIYFPMRAANCLMRSVRRAYGLKRPTSLVRHYLRVLLSFAPAFLLNNVLLCFVRNDSAPRLAMTAMLGGSFSNIVLDYIFIFPLNLGIFGAVLATGLAPVISIMIQAPHFRKSTLRLKRQGLRLRGTGRLAVLGCPSLISELSSGLVLILFNFIILDLAGNLGVAGYGVVANIYLVVLALFTGLGQGIQPLVSAAWGRKERDCVYTVYRYALWAAALLAIGVYALSILLDDPIVAAFNRERDPLLQEIAVRGLHLYFLAFFFAGFNVVTAVFFSSMDRPRAGFAVSILRGFVLIVPLAVFMSQAWGMDGVWLSAPVTEAMTALVAVIILKTTKSA